MHFHAPLRPSMHANRAPSPRPLQGLDGLNTPPSINSNDITGCKVDVGIMSSIYIIGAQCTGKTTLVKAVSERIQAEQPGLQFATIKELARGILISANVNRNDIRAGSVKAMEFQKLVLEAQLEQERSLQRFSLFISDRSGIDPIAYATKYGPPEVAEEMLETATWSLLRDRMRWGLIVLCEPVSAWLFDDGVRLMPKDNQEWLELHEVFVDLLRSCGIGFEILPTTCTDIEERTRFVVERWRRHGKNKVFDGATDGRSSGLGRVDDDINTTATA